MPKKKVLNVWNRAKGLGVDHQKQSFSCMMGGQNIWDGMRCRTSLFCLLYCGISDISGPDWHSMPIIGTTKNVSRFSYPPPMGWHSPYRGLQYPFGCVGFLQCDLIIGSSQCSANATWRRWKALVIPCLPSPQGLKISVLWTLYYGILSAFAPVYSWILVLRGLVGFGIGGVPQS